MTNTYYRDWRIHCQNGTSGGGEHCHNPKHPGWLVCWDHLNANTRRGLHRLGQRPTDGRMHADSHCHVQDCPCPYRAEQTGWAILRDGGILPKVKAVS